MGEVVVLGPTGNVGSRLILRLLERGLGVRTGNREDFDFHQPSTYVPLFRGATHLFLLTPVVQEMVALTEGLLRAARLAGIEHVVRLSAFGASRISPARILRWHGEAEELVRKSSLPYTILRPSAFMQNFIDHYGRSIKERSLLALPAGNSRVSFIDAEDIARVASEVLVDPSFRGEALEITGPAAISFPEACGSLSSVLDREVRFVDAEETAVRSRMIQAGVPPWRIDLTMELYASYRRGEAQATTQAVTAVTRSAPRKIFEFFTQHREEWK